MKLVDYLTRGASAHGYDYPSWYILLAVAAEFASVVTATTQRIVAGPTVWALVGGVVALIPCTLFVARANKNGAAMTILVGSGSALLMTQQVGYDLAPVILIVMAVMVSASSPRWVAVFTTAVSVLVIVVFFQGDSTELHFNISGVLFASLLGIMLLGQLQLLHKERDAQVVRSRTAASDERRRIASEIHDVVAHSLSITLLNVTGARRALQQDRDVDEAIDALTDAERIGRQAMADIRRTVGLLDVGPSKNAPEPGLADIDELIEDFRRAGLPVRYDMHGEPSAVTAATGLSLYRVTQESLANVAKHAPGAAVDVSVTITNGGIALEVANGTPSGPPAHPQLKGGNGLKGMRQRIESLGGWLTAGPEAAGWRVQAEVPNSSSSSCLGSRILGAVQ